MKNVLCSLLICLSLGVHAQTYTRTYSEDFAELVKNAHGGYTGASGLVIRDYKSENNEDRFYLSQKGYFSVQNGRADVRSFSIFGSPKYSDFEPIHNTPVDIEVVCHMGVAEEQNRGFTKRGYYGIELSAVTADNKSVSYVLLLDGKTYSVVRAKKDIWIVFKDADELVSKTKSDFVKKGEENVLKIQKSGTEWKFFVNGNLVHTLTDDTHLFINDDLISNIISGVHGEIYVNKYSYTFRKAL